MNKSLLGNCIRYCFIVFCFFFIISCQTVKQEYPKINYTDELARKLEITRIEKSLELTPVTALWRAKLLVSEAPQSIEAQTIFTQIENAVYELLQKAVSAANNQEIKRLYNSLEAIQSAKLAEFAIKPNMLSDFSKTLQKTGLQTAANTRVAQMIRGTVTVWVDLGIKIERGMGYADRVIGSGFFIDKRGYIVTNHHVIASEVDPKYKGVSRLYIRLADDPDTRIPAKVVGWDEALDLALLKTEVDAPFVFPLGSSSDLETGDRIWAIGSPAGLDRTITGGIVSATDRKLFAMGDVMQIDAAINSGNSGGPIIDQNGNVQGVVFAGIKPYEGLNFAIPVEYLKLELDRLQSGGKVKHAWFGAFGKTKKELGSTKTYGVEIVYVTPGSPAYIAGINAGDTIDSINGQTVESIEQLKIMLLSIAPETIITVKGKNAHEHTIEKIVCVNVRPENPGYEIYQRDLIANAFLPIFGMQLTSISDTFSKRYYISSVLKASIADESGFSEMDPIEINRIRVTPEKDALIAEFFIKKRKSGYLDTFLTIGAQLDNPNYF